VNRVVLGANIRRARARKGASLEAVAAQCGHRGPWLCKVEAGTHTASTAALVRLSEVLDISLKELGKGAGIASDLDLGDLGPVSALAGLDLPWTERGGMAALRLITDGDTMDRRSFLAVAGLTATGPAREWSGLAPLRDVGKAGTEKLPPEIVTDVDEMSVALIKMADRIGVVALSWTQDHLRHVRAMLDRHSYDSATGAGLNRSVALLLKQCGCLAFDARDHGLAQRYWNSAIRVAHVAGDRAIAAGTIQNMAQQAVERGLRTDAVRFATAAQDGYRNGSSPGLKMLLAMQAARTQAMYRDAPGARRSIQQGLGAVHSGGEDPWWVTNLVDSGTPYRRAASVHALLGDWPAVTDYLTRTDGEAKSGRRKAVQQLRLAISYARQREIEQALALGTTALDTLTGPAESPRGLAFARELADDLYHFYRRPGVREFTARVRELPV
jgi:transcriptional regulator with XRE-family HTH domain